jgi:ankyrin repeat protein
VELLVKAGANVNARARGSATPLMMAEVMKREDVADLLRKAGAKPWQK